MATKTTAERVDYLVENHGCVFLFRPLNAAARAWLAGSVQADAQWWGGALAVEHRYARDLAANLQHDGFELR